MREKCLKESTNNNNGQQQQVVGEKKKEEEQKKEKERYAGKEGRACAHAQSKMPSPKRIRCVTAT